MLRKVEGRFQPEHIYLKQVGNEEASLWDILWGDYRQIVVYRFYSGKYRQEGYYNSEKYEYLLKAQLQEPQVIGISETRTWWMFQNEYYWEDDGLTSMEIKALILDRKQKKKKQIQKALENLQKEEKP